MLLCLSGVVLFEGGTFCLGVDDGDGDGGDSGGAGGATVSSGLGLCRPKFFFPQSILVFDPRP